MPVVPARIEGEIEEDFLAAGGPGGQNVNKTASAVRLRFNIGRSSAFSEAEKARLREALAARLTAEGDIVIFAQEHRSQIRNREAARARLFALLANALRRQRPRIATRHTRASKERRLDAKSRRSAVKRGRSTRAEE